jgi:DNA repair protein RecO (recombination protein O)
MTACALIEGSFPERAPHAEMYDALKNLLEALAHSDSWLRAYVDFEHTLLNELGYGLDLSECAATGSTENLIYVSPKSGRAVSEQAGEPYKDKLLNLPSFLTNNKQPTTNNDIASSLLLTGYFLKKYRENIAHTPLPDARQRLMEALEV